MGTDHIGTIPLQQFNDVLNEAWAVGINTLDTAPVYIDSEWRLGNYFDQTQLPFQIQTKGGFPFDIGCMQSFRLSSFFHRSFASFFLCFDRRHVYISLERHSDRDSRPHPGRDYRLAGETASQHHSVPDAPRRLRFPQLLDHPETADPCLQHPVCSVRSCSAQQVRPAWPVELEDSSNLHHAGGGDGHSRPRASSGQLSLLLADGNVQVDDHPHCLPSILLFRRTLAFAIQSNQITGRSAGVPRGPVRHELPAGHQAHDLLLSSWLPHLLPRCACFASDFSFSNVSRNNNNRVGQGEGGGVQSDSARRLHGRAGPFSSSLRRPLLAQCARCHLPRRYFALP